MEEPSNDFHIHTTDAPDAGSSGESISSASPAAPVAAAPQKGLSFLKGIIIGLIAFAALGCALWSYLILQKNLTDRWSLAFAQAVHLPAGFVNRTELLYSDYADDERAVNMFYETNRKKDPSAPLPDASALRASVWDRMVRTALMDEFASAHGIAVSSQDIDAEFGKLATALGSSDAAGRMIQESYGWPADKFKERVLRPFLVEQKIMTTTSTADIVLQKSRARAEDVLAKVRDGKQTFQDLAKQYSEDGSAAQGGDLGWFDESTMVKPFSDAAFALKPNEISGIVQTPFGFHIIKVLERDEKKGKPIRIHAAHILIRADLEGFLKDRKAQSTIKQWVRVE